MGVTKAYSTLRESATKRKLAGVDFQRWSAIESRAELLESSFMTPQVTWNSAERASSDLKQKLQGVSTNNEVMLTAFKSSAEDALKKQEAFQAECR